MPTRVPVQSVSHISAQVAGPAGQASGAGLSVDSVSDQATISQRDGTPAHSVGAGLQGFATQCPLSRQSHAVAVEVQQPLCPMASNLARGLNGALCQGDGADGGDAGVGETDVVGGHVGCFVVCFDSLRFPFFRFWRCVG